MNFIKRAIRNWLEIEELENKLRVYPADPPPYAPSPIISYFLPGYSEQQVAEAIERESKRKRKTSYVICKRG